jgi:integrase/recombinase XerD
MAEPRKMCDSLPHIFSGGRSPLDAAPDARGRLILALLALEHLSFEEVARLRDGDLDPGALAEATASALDAYLEEREGPAGGPLIRHSRHRGRGLSVVWLEDMVYSWDSGLDGRRRFEPDVGLCALARRYVAQRRAAGQLARSTVPSLRRCLVCFALSVGNCAPGQVVRADVERWVSRPGLSAGTRRKELSAIRTFFRWLVLEGEAGGDPTLGIPPIRQPRQLPRGLRATQVAALLAACPDARARLIVLLEVQEGLRSCEVSRARVEDVDPHQRSMLVHGKGGHERALPLSGETWDALVAYLGEWPAHTGPLVRSYNDPSRGITPEHVRHLMRAAFADAGIDASGHALRHTCATDMLLGGAHIRNVQAALGHANLATTSRYLPLVVGELRDAMGGRRYG